MGKIGLQLYSIKELLKDDFIGGLYKVKEIGYDGIEFAGFYDVSAPELSKTLDDAGLERCGSHTSFKLLINNLEEVIEYNLAIRNKYIVCPSLPAKYRESTDAWKETSEIFNNIGQKCKDNGLLFGFHNHGVEFDKHDGKHGFDILCENTDPSLVFLEIDTFWVEHAGLRSVDFMNKYNDRLPLIHIKDMKGWEDKVSTEIGKGVMDFKEICGLAKRFGTEWFIVEQEEFEIPQDESIKISLEYLRSIL